MPHSCRAEASGSAEAGALVLDTPKPCSRVTGALPAARLSEERDDYPAIVDTLNARWRVIDSKCGLQWILQRRQGKAENSWRGSAYCRSRDGLLSNIRERCNDPDEAALRAVERLPAWHK